MSYPPYGYQPFQQTMQVQPMQQQVTDVWVASEDEVNRHQVLANCSVRFWHINEDVFWIKQGDGMGHPTTRKFNYKEDTSAFPVPVTRDEFNALVAKVERLIPTNSEPQKEVEA